MKVNQLSLTENDWQKQLSSIDFKANLFMLFISPGYASLEEVLNNIKLNFPEAAIIGCSTAGEISGVTVKDNSIALTAIQLEKTKIKKVAHKIDDMKSSENVGIQIANDLISDDLKHVIILSDGLNVNGADLVSGLKTKLLDISITGGLAADGSDFNQTFSVLKF